MAEILFIFLFVFVFFYFYFYFFQRGKFPGSAESW